MSGAEIVGLSAESALPLVLMSLGAIAMPPAAKKIAIPVAVAEIVFGFVIGGSGFDLAGDPNNPFIRFLSDLGFAFFLFLAGLEIDFQGIERRVRELALPFVSSSLAFVLSISISHYFGWGIWPGIAIGATSVPLLLAVVREMQLNTSPLGQTMIAFAAMGELITILVLSLVEVHTVANGDVSKMAFGLFLLFSLVSAAILGASFLRTIMWWYPHYFTQLTAHDDPTETGIRVGFGMMFSFIGLSILTHTEPFLGAFIAGAILSFTIRNKGALEHKLASMAYGFFVPIFFIHVGMRLDLSFGMLAKNGQEILLILAVMLVVKLLPGALLRLRKMQWPVIIATSSLLAAPLTLVIAIMELGVKNDAVKPEMSASVICAGIAASLIFPSIARKLLQDEVPEKAEVVVAHH